MSWSRRKHARKPLLVKIRSFWHNTFDDIIGNRSDRSCIAAVTAHFGPASLDGEPDTEGLDPDGAMVLASVGQGISFETMRETLELDVNPSSAATW